MRPLQRGCSVRKGPLKLLLKIHINLLVTLEPWLQGVQLPALLAVSRR